VATIMLININNIVCIVLIVYLINVNNIVCIVLIVYLINNNNSESHGSLNMIGIPYHVKRHQ